MQLNSNQHIRLKQVSIICVLFCFLFIYDFKVYADSIITEWDRQLFDRFYDTPPSNEPMWTIMDGISEAGHYRSVMGLSILLMAYGDEEHRNTGKLLSSAYISSGIMTYGLKHVIRRKRPLDDTLGNPSLPSGHATIAFSAATILGYRYPKWRIPLYIGAGLVGFSRIYLGRHYTSDVLAGAAIGTTMGVLVWHNRVTLLKWEF